jgi:hypothetical protein
MKLLLVSGLVPDGRCVAAVHGYVAAGKALGHEVAVFGAPDPTLPSLPFTTDVSGFDLALFVIQVVQDLPAMPHLARLLDNIPRERRAVVDLWGRFNDTIRVDDDFNHLEELEGHLGWEWVESLQAISDTILQPTLAPLRPGVRSFLFHAYDAGSVARPRASAREAAAAWRGAGPDERPYGVMYVGHNWQRWVEVSRFLQQYGSLRDRLGKPCLIGLDWDRRPEWAVKKGIKGVDVDVALLAELDVEIRGPVRFDEVIGVLGKARFAPVLHRPLFRRLGLVTSRTFETFSADTMPVLMLPEDLVEAVYGPEALALVPRGDVAAHLTDAMRRPDVYWDAVLRTRSHLSLHHSFERRFQELQSILDG